MAKYNLRQMSPSASETQEIYFSSEVLTCAAEASILLKSNEKTDIPSVLPPAQHERDDLMVEPKNKGEKFLDKLLQYCAIKSDSELARQLGLHRSTISYVRYDKRAVSDTILLAAYEKLNVPVTLMRDWLKEGDDDGTN